MTLGQVFEIVRRRFPSITNTEILEYVNEAIDEFIEEVDITTGFFTETTVADQRLYPFSGIAADGVTPANSRLYSIKDVWIGNEPIRRYAGDIDPLDTT